MKTMDDIGINQYSKNNKVDWVKLRNSILLKSLNSLTNNTVLIIAPSKIGKTQIEELKHHLLFDHYIDINVFTRLIIQVNGTETNSKVLKTSGSINSINLHFTGKKS